MEITWTPFEFELYIPPQVRDVELEYDLLREQANKQGLTDIQFHFWYYSDKNTARPKVPNILAYRKAK